MELVIGLTVLFAMLVVFVIALYNRLISGRNYVHDAWSGIDVQLMKRHNLIPLLVDIVKAYSGHENELLTKVTQLRAPGSRSNSQKTELAENSFGSEFSGLLMLAEAYPDIKVDQNFRQLQSQLYTIEADIESARRYYNGSVRDFNIAVESFPSNLVAKQFGFTTKRFFEIVLPTIKNVPKVDL